VTIATIPQPRKRIAGLTAVENTLLALIARARTTPAQKAV
jgi:hypothetical protein